ncbi:MAG: hypothetical protein ACRC9L_07475 [Brevinema sp.]
MKCIYSLLLFFTVLTGCSVAPDNVAIKFGSSPSIESLTPTSDYVIYSDEATLPTLYNALSFLSHNKPSLIWVGRAGTLDTSRFPSHVTSVASNDVLRERIAQINKSNPNATFTFFMNDLRVAKIQRLFYSQGISSNRVRSVMLSDGTATYKNFSTSFKGAGSFSRWNYSKEIFRQRIAESDPLDNDTFLDSNYFLVAPDANRTIEFWIQWPELMRSQDESLCQHLEATTAKYYKVTPFNYFQSLSSDKRAQFEQLVGLDKKWASGEGDSTLNDQTIAEALNASPKPNILIVGTNPYGAKTDEYIAKIKALYGNNYDYFFKGHPSDTTHPSDTSIVVLPFRLPMEAIMWVYGDNIAVLGGYESSLFMSASQQVKKFFFPQSKTGEALTGNSLLEPLDAMYQQGLLGDVTFIQ